jgi:hypothetical protein
MNDLKQRFENNYLLGCIRHKGEYSIYLMPIAWWILNYKKYDPTYNPADWKDVYRDNILNVSDGVVDDFMKSIEEDKVIFNEFGTTIDDIPIKYRHIHFFIDFDNKLFVNGFYDNIELEEYLPDRNWVGRIDDPNNYLPNDLKSDFKT